MTVTMPEQQPEQTSDLARFTAMVAAYAAAQEALRVNLMALILRYWRLVTNPFAPDQVTQYGEGVAVAVRAAQKRSMDLSVAHQRALLGDMDVKLPRFAMDLPEQPRGVDPVEVAQRALREARILESAGDRTALNPVPLSRAEAMDRGLQRALRMANDDVDLAAREGAQQAFARVPDVVIGYRRVIHPELSRGGTCGLCAAAADRTYTVGELLPIHSGCNCSVSPITPDQDPGDEQNQVDLGVLYRLANGTGGKELSRVRFQIDRHGELGPTLRPRSKGAGDPAVQIAQIDETLAGLGTWAQKNPDVDLGAAQNAQLDERNLLTNRK